MKAKEPREKQGPAYSKSKFCFFASLLGFRKDMTTEGEAGAKEPKIRKVKLGGYSYNSQPGVHFPSCLPNQPHCLTHSMDMSLSMK